MRPSALCNIPSTAAVWKHPDELILAGAEQVEGDERERLGVRRVVESADGYTGRFVERRAGAECLNRSAFDLSAVPCG